MMKSIVASGLVQLRVNDKIRNSGLLLPPRLSGDSTKPADLLAVDCSFLLLLFVYIHVMCYRLRSNDDFIHSLSALTLLLLC